MRKEGIEPSQDKSPQVLSLLRFPVRYFLNESGRSRTCFAQASVVYVPGTPQTQFRLTTPKHESSIQPPTDAPELIRTIITWLTATRNT